MFLLFKKSASQKFKSSFFRYEYISEITSYIQKGFNMSIREPKRVSYKRETIWG